MSHGRFDSPIQASLTGLKDLFGQQALAEQLTDELRLDGKTCLVTGASSGLGFAMAVQLAQRGAKVIMVSRSGGPDKEAEVRRLSASERVEAIQVDLSDLEQVHNLADILKERGEQIDVLVENAGMASPRAKQTPQGLEAMFVTNYVAKFLLVHRLLTDGTIPNRTLAGARAEGPPARILFISSDSHQGASAIDWEELGVYQEFDVNKAIHNYSYFKLVMNTYACELARRLSSGGDIDVAVHVMCPGPVDTNIIREAPIALRLLLGLIFKVFFRRPDVAAKPAVYMCVAPEFQEQTLRYLHMFRPKPMDAKCYDTAEGAKLWDRTVELLRSVAMWTAGAD